MKLSAPGFRIRTCYQAVFAPDGEHLAVIGRDAVLWSVSERRVLRSMRLLTHPSAVAFGPDSATFLVKNTGGELALCETRTADPIARFVPTSRDEGAAPVFAGPGLILDGSWDGAVYERLTAGLIPAVTWRDEHVMITRVWRTEERCACLAIAKHTHPAFGRDGGADAILVSEGRDSKKLQPLERRWTALRDAALSPTGSKLAVRFGASDRRVEVLALTSERVLAAAPSGFAGTGAALTWSPDGETLVIVEEGGFSFRNAADLCEVAFLEMAYPASAAFSPNGDLVAAGGWSGGIVARWPDLLTQLSPRRGVGSDSHVA